MPNKHIFVGGSKDIEYFFDALNQKYPIKWAVPATATLGDKGIFLLAEHGFLAVGEIITAPKEDRNPYTGWGADLQINYGFDPISLTIIQFQMIEWSAIQGRSPWARSFMAPSGHFWSLVSSLKRELSLSQANALEKALS